MNKLNSIIYRLRNVLFLLFMVGLIRLIPNIKELEFIGTIFIIFVFIYLLLDLYFYGCKSKELNNNKFQNILVILLYIYVFIVSQRTSSIQDADLIIVLDEGKMAGIGTHEQLLKNCPVYKEIALSQLSLEELE